MEILIIMFIQCKKIKTDQDSYRNFDIGEKKNVNFKKKHNLMDVY